MGREKDKRVIALYKQVSPHAHSATLAGATIYVFSSNEWYEYIKKRALKFLKQYGASRLPEADKIMDTMLRAGFLEEEI